MNGDDKDPMLFGDVDKQKNYRDSLMNTMRDAIAEDRINRREPSRPETPGALIGGTGLPSGLTQSL